MVTYLIFIALLGIYLHFSLFLLLILLKAYLILFINLLFHFLWFLIIFEINKCPALRASSWVLLTHA